MSASTKVLDWLSTTGFPLEMSAASALLDAGFEVTQSHIYEDPQTEKAREVDVFARDPDMLGLVDISLIVECKSSANPWVVLRPTGGEAAYSRLLAFALTSAPARSHLTELILDSALPSYVSDCASRGYGMRQAFTKDADPAHVGAFSLLKACAAATYDVGTGNFPRHAFAFPVLVVDSPLFECSRDSEGQLHLSEVDSSSFLFINAIPKQVGCRIQVVTEKYLKMFAAQARQTANQIRKDFQHVQDKYLPPSPSDEA